LHSVAPEFAMIENMRMARRAMPLVSLFMKRQIAARSRGLPYR
jgi:hypothetical protein